MQTGGQYSPPHSNRVTRGRQTANVDPRPGSVLTSTVPPWALDDGADEAQAESEPAFGSTLVAAIEALPDAGQVVRGDADARVGDLNRAHRSVARGADGHRSPRRACT